SIESAGSITITGDNSTAIAITGGAGAGVAGDVLATGSITMRGANAVGLLVDAPIGGELRLNGGWQVTGYRYITRSVDLADLDADDLLQSGSAVHVRYSVAGGVTVEGLGVENDTTD